MDSIDKIPNRNSEKSERVSRTLGYLAHQLRQSEFTFPLSKLKCVYRQHNDEVYVQELSVRMENLNNRLANTEMNMDISGNELAQNTCNALAKKLENTTLLLSVHYIRKSLVPCEFVIKPPLKYKIHKLVESGVENPEEKLIDFSTLPKFQGPKECDFSAVALQTAGGITCLNLDPMSLRRDANFVVTGPFFPVVVSSEDDGEKNWLQKNLEQLKYGSILWTEQLRIELPDFKNSKALNPREVVNPDMEAKKKRSEGLCLMRIPESYLEEERIMAVVPVRQSCWKKTDVVCVA